MNTFLLAPPEADFSLPPAEYAVAERDVLLDQRPDPFDRVGVFGFVQDDNDLAGIHLPRPEWDEHICTGVALLHIQCRSRGLADQFIPEKPKQPLVGVSAGFQGERELA